jgi:hypothetical protein
VTGCGIFSNSSDPASISVDGNNDVIHADSTGTVGGTSITGNVNTQVSATTGNPPLQDPYASEAASWPTSPTITPPTTTCGGCAPQTCTPAGKKGNPPENCTLQPGSYASAVTLTAGPYTLVANGTYLFSGGLTVNSGVTLNIGSGVTLIIKGAGWTNHGTVLFGSGNYSIAITAGGWSNSGTVTFGGGNYSLAIQAGGWTDTGTTNFGNGNYTMSISGGWTPGNPLTMGTGNYTVSVTGNWTIGGSAPRIGAGIYYISGNLNITGSGNQTVTANNVTLVLTGDTATTSVINFTANNSTFTLSAPTTGWNAGIAVWEPNTGKTFSSPPPSNTLASGNNSTASIAGVFYAPAADVQLLGNTGTAPNCTQILAKSIEFGGNSINIHGNCDGVAGVKKFGQIIALVE